MCGIAGFTGVGEETQLRDMINSIRYRGPDAQVAHWREGIGLAHARLSILDLREEGNQPMFTGDRQLAITYNGEIYNFKELKKELSPKYSFSTTTDTEVLLYLYREFGVKMLDRLNGMFAFAIYDFGSRRLFLARDRMGKKPLYYSVSGQSFIFASELKAVLKHPSVKNSINIEALNQYLTFDYIPNPNSLVSGVNKLEPGHFLLVEDNRITTNQAYWKHDFRKNVSIRFDEAKERLHELLNAATARRLMSDVPLGVFLSGGLDSSTVAYYAQKNFTRKISTFSIGFEDKSYDESDYARKVSTALGTEHHMAVMTPKEALAMMDEILPKLDEPFADASLIPTYYLSKFTKKHVTVALGGDGSDELLAGYPTFLSDYFRKPFSWLPAPSINYIIKCVSALLPASDKNISFDFKLKQFLRGFTSENNHTHQLWLGSFLPAEKEKLLKREVFASLSDKSGLRQIDLHYKSTDPAWSNFDKDAYYYYRTYLLDDILFKVDRASMYNSLEVRAPFMDREVVEFLNSLPANFKLRGFKEKFLLKKLMEDKLPAEIIARPKKGFGIPLSDWIRKDLKEEINAVLLNKDDFFNQSYIELLIRQHHSGRYNHRKLIWNLYVIKKLMYTQKYC